MGRLGKREAEEAADALADKLDEMADVAKATKAGEDNDGASSVNGVVAQRLNTEAADGLCGILNETIELALLAPTVGDEGAGDGPLHRDFLKRMAERGYSASGATGENLVVTIPVDEDSCEKLDVYLLQQSSEPYC